MDGTFQTGAISGERVSRVAEREVEAFLIGERSVIDNVISEVVLPGGDNAEQVFCWTSMNAMR